MIWAFPEMGVPPVIIHFNGIFPNKNHPTIGVPPWLGKAPYINIYWDTLLQFLFFFQYQEFRNWTKASPFRRLTSSSHHWWSEAPAGHGSAMTWGRIVWSSEISRGIPQGIRWVLYLKSHNEPLILWRLIPLIDVALLTFVLKHLLQY